MSQPSQSKLNQVITRLKTFFSQNNLDRLYNYFKRRYFFLRENLIVRFLLRLLSLGILVYSIVCSVFAGVLSRYDNFNVVWPIPFIQEQSTDIPNIEIKSKEVSKNTEYRFLFLVDYRGSAIIKNTSKITPTIKEYERTVKPVKDELAIEINGADPPNQISLNALIPMYILDNLQDYTYSQNSKFTVAYVDTTIHYLLSENNNRAWRGFNEAQIDTALNRVQKYPIQKISITDFENVLSKTNKYLLDKATNSSYKSKNTDAEIKLIVTIISDFYHNTVNKSLTKVEPCIKELSEHPDITEINIIKLPTFNDLEQEKSKKLIQKFEKYIKFIPHSRDNVLNILYFNSNDFPAKLRAIITPTNRIETIKDKKEELSFYYTNHLDTASSIITLPAFDNIKEDDITLMLNLKSNKPDEMENINVEVIEVNKEMEEMSSNTMYYGNPLSFEMKPENKIKFAITHLPKVNQLPDFEVEIYQEESNNFSNSTKFLLPFISKEKLPKTAVSLIYYSFYAIIIAITGLILCFLYVFIKYNKSEIKTLEERIIEVIKTQYDKGSQGISN